MIVPFSALAIVVGCSGEPPQLAAADPARLNEQVFAVAYSRIADAYLQPVDLAALGINGLSGLAGVDASFRVDRTGRAVRVYAANQLTGEYVLPSNGDATGWASLTVRAVERARLYSAPLREVPAERIYQTVFDAVTTRLDGYSRYSSAQRASGERAQREGYGGIGVTLDFEGGRPVVRSLVANGPAERAGMRSGDIITTIDGMNTAGVSDTVVRDRLRGPTGASVGVTTTRDGALRKVTLRRERVVPNTLTVATENGIGVLKLERFNAATANNVRDAVLGLHQTLGPRARGIVLDLRGNPGGLLDQAVAVADLFIPRGRIITTEGRHPDSRQRWDAAADDVADGLPMVVLVDGRSASSAEVVAAALQDSGRAVVVGASSFGKGSVQTVTRLPNDGELFLTWSRIYTPAGYTLHRQGVQPTICTSRGVDSPAELLSDLREGRTPSALQLAGWRAKAPDDDFALHQLRDACPWREHEPQLDLKVARLLLTDVGLYERAVALSTGHAVAER